jgi:hypothetical protein
MLTYMTCKHAIRDSYDLEDLATTLSVILFIVVVDIVFIFLQPLFYIIYKKWSKENNTY